MEFPILQLILHGLVSAVTLANLAAVVIGLFFGIVGGMLPGISVVTAIALALPFTFGLPTQMALLSLGSIFVGATYGGSIAAILINTPGQPGSVATAFDGYAMTRKGKAPQAMTTALLASVVGGVIGVLILLIFFAPLSAIALEFGPAELFWLAIFGLTTIAAMSSGNVLKGLLGAVIGLLISTVGLDPVVGTPRFTFGYYPLVQGFDLVVVMIGIFSFSQMLVLMESNNNFIARYTPGKGVLREVSGYLFGRCKRLLLQSSLIGTFVGTLPGAGGSVSAIIAYNEARRWDKKPERFGTGAIEGLVAPESANNAGVGGSLVPLLSLGIPGNAAAAVLMGGLLSQGITPGPQLLENSAGEAYDFIVGLLLVNLIMLPVGLLVARASSNALRVPKNVIVPIVIVLSVIGAYSIRNNALDVVIMMGAGLGAYLLMRVDIQPGPIALGLVLGPMIEESLSVTLRLAQARDSVMGVLVFQPIPAALIILCLLSLFLPMLIAGVARMRVDKGRAGASDLAADVMTHRSARGTTLATCLFLGGVVVLFWVQTNGLRYPSDVFPKLVIAALGILLVLTGADAARGGAASHTSAAIVPRAQIRTILAICVLVLGYVLTFPLLGFYLTTAIFLVAGLSLTRVGSGEPWSTGMLVSILLIAIGATLVVFSVFAGLLGVPTPRGLLI